MMKMAIGDGSPSDRVPEQAPERFLVATETYGGGTPDLGFFLEVLGYIRGVGVGNKAGGSPGCPRGRGERPGGGRTPTLVGIPRLFWPNSFTPWPSSDPKISFVKFQVNWTPFGFPFLRYSKTTKKIETGTRL